ncbi:MAG TPA: carboxymuconolactone decarboxylase family protein [Sphingomonas sp.]|jgi:AhpD family alkylhydroperoxidase|nr:carboxymuconolactone decarboxylase family protein [Sphingomonas sp.]
MHRLDYNIISPEGAKSLGGVYVYLSQCGLAPSLIELTYLRVSQINNCAYCLDMHGRALLELGEKPERLVLVQAWAEAGSLFDKREQAALSSAEAVTRVGQANIPEPVYEAVRSVFSEKELVDLTIAISLMNAYNRLAISFRNAPKASGSDEN